MSTPCDALCRAMQPPLRHQPQAPRHSFATYLLEEGADVRSIQERLGQVQSSTRQHYAHVKVPQLMDVYKELDPRASAAAKGELTGA